MLSLYAGPTLLDVIEGPLAVKVTRPWAFEVAIQLTRTLRLLSSLGISHNDLKPSNVCLTPTSTPQNVVITPPSPSALASIPINTSMHSFSTNSNYCTSSNTATTTQHQKFVVSSPRAPLPARPRTLPPHVLVIDLDKGPRDTSPSLFPQRLTWWQNMQARCMAPEVREGLGAVPASEVYSLGVLLRWLFSYLPCPPPQPIHRWIVAAHNKLPSRRPDLKTLLELLLEYQDSDQDHMHTLTTLRSGKKLPAGRKWKNRIGEDSAESTGVCSDSSKRSGRMKYHPLTINTTLDTFRRCPHSNTQEQVESVKKKEPKK